MDGGKLVLQIIKVVIGFILAVLACGLFLSWGFFRAGAPEVDPVGFAAMVVTGFITASVVGAVAMVPALAFVTLAELARLRGFLFHVGAAGAIAFGAWTFGGDAEISGLRPGSTIALAAGFVAGIVYWLIAGRSSGCWRPSKNV